MKNAAIVFVHSFNLRSPVTNNSQMNKVMCFYEWMNEWREFIPSSYDFLFFFIFDILISGSNVYTYS